MLYCVQKPGTPLTTLYWTARQAVIDFPNDFHYLEWLATSEYYLAFDENPKDSPSVEYFNDLMDNSLRRFEYIIDNCNEPQIYRKAVLGKIVGLRFLDRIIEAEWSTQFEYPDETISSVDDALKLCMEGRELLSYLEKEAHPQAK